MHIQWPSKGGGGGREPMSLVWISKVVVLRIEEEAMSVSILNYCICNFAHRCCSFNLLYVTISFVLCHCFKDMLHVRILPKTWPLYSNLPQLFNMWLVFSLPVLHFTSIIMITLPFPQCHQLPHGPHQTDCWQRSLQAPKRPCLYRWEGIC